MHRIKDYPHAIKINDLAQQLIVQFESYVQWVNDAIEYDTHSSPGFYADMSEDEFTEEFEPFLTSQKQAQDAIEYLKPFTIADGKSEG